jgi:hypothetical protein
VFVGCGFVWWWVGGGGLGVVGGLCGVVVL